MTRRRWIADEISADRASLLGAHAEHLSRVLRAQVGQAFDITTGDEVRRGRITSITEGKVEFELGDAVPASAPLQVTLVLAIFKFDRMEWAIEKCTELGVARIIPVIARRTEAYLSAAAPKRVDRWRKIAVQATEQSRRISTPEVCSPVKLKEATALPGVRIFLSENERSAMLKDVLVNRLSEALVIAVGPEGGWSDDESKRFQEEGWLPASLGGTILRAETAAIAAMAICQSELT